MMTQDFFRTTDKKNVIEPPPLFRGPGCLAPTMPVAVCPWSEFPLISHRAQCPIVPGGTADALP